MALTGIFEILELLVKEISLPIISRQDVVELFVQHSDEVAIN